MKIGLLTPEQRFSFRARRQNYGCPVDGDTPTPIKGVSANRVLFPSLTYEFEKFLPCPCTRKMVGDQREAREAEAKHAHPVGSRLKPTGDVVIACAKRMAGRAEHAYLQESRLLAACDFPGPGLTGYNNPSGYSGSKEQDQEVELSPHSLPHVLSISLLPKRDQPNLCLRRWMRSLL